MTQTDQVLALLRSRGAEGLTPMDALREAGTMRLAARIADLRADGHVITTEIITTPNGKRVARYVLTDLRLEWDGNGQRIVSTKWHWHMLEAEPLTHEHPGFPLHRHPMAK